MTELPRCQACSQPLQPSWVICPCGRSRGKRNRDPAYWEDPEYEDPRPGQDEIRRQALIDSLRRVRND
jgi:hypothetical protein